MSAFWWFVLGLAAGGGLLGAGLVLLWRLVLTANAVIDDRMLDQGPRPRTYDGGPEDAA